MAATPDVLAQKSSSNRLRSGAAINQSTAAGSSPRTPISRSLTSAYGSPSSSYRSDDETAIFEFGARYFRAGFAGESCPRCILDYGPNEQRRAGDYRQWLPDGGETVKKDESIASLGNDYELWPLDLRKADMQLVQDKVGRALREARIKYLLSDAKPKRVLLVVPSLVAHSLLALLLTSVFTIYNPASITLASSATLSVMAAGQRSGLVIDIGWAETTVSVIYEYREVRQERSQRAGKLLVKAMAATLLEEVRCHRSSGDVAVISFSDSEEVLIRRGWCLSAEEAGHDCTSALVSVNTAIASSAARADRDNLVMIHLKDARTSLNLPFRKLSIPAEKALFAQGKGTKDLDDHDLPLHVLVYKAFLSVSMDVRTVCMSRITFTGGVSHLPGLKRRVLEELCIIMNDRGWNPVKNYGTALAVGYQGRKRTTRLAPIKSAPIAVSSGIDAGEEDHTASETDEKPDSRGPAMDEIDKRIQAHKNKDKREEPRGSVRAVGSLGPWAGGSLMASLRIRGIVDVERESFLQHGLSGASKDRPTGSVQQRQGTNFASRPNAEDRSGWTLGAWA